VEEIDLVDCCCDDEEGQLLQLLGGEDAWNAVPIGYIGSYVIH
jgi:hypothetical protein